MLHVILLILKILGIIFLIIAAFLLLILCSVLFVAAGYQVHMEKKDAFRVTARAGWLFRIVTVYFSLDGTDPWKQRLQLRLFGFPIWDPYAEKKPKKKRRKRRRRPKDGKALVSGGQAQTTGNPKQVSEVQAPEVQAPDDDTETPPNRTVPEPDTEYRIEPSAEPKKRKESFPEKIGSFFRRVIYAIKGICDKIKHMKKKILGIGDAVRELLKRKDALLAFWNLEEHRRARGAVWKEVQYLWKKFRPKRIEGKITFGFDDPSITGLCMGGVSMLCAWYPEKLRIIPDFEQMILEGDVLIKGKVRFYVLACILWRVYFNQDIRHMYEHWKQL